MCLRHFLACMSLGSGWCRGACPRSHCSRYGVHYDQAHVISLLDIEHMYSTSFVDTTGSEFFIIMRQDNEHSSISKSLSNQSIYPRLRSQVAYSGTNSTPLWLERDGVHAPLTHAIRDLVQTRQSRIYSRRDITARATPEEFCRRRCTRPNDWVQILRAGLFGPKVVLA